MNRISFKRAQNENSCVEIFTSNSQFKNLFHSYDNVIDRFPIWIYPLLKIRDSLVKIFDLYTFKNEAIKSSKELITGEFIGPFLIRKLEPSYVELFYNDKHLDCTIFIDQNSSKIELINHIRFKNSLGRYYFNSIKPMHDLIFKSLIKRATSS